MTEAEARIKQDILVEIQTLQENYKVLASFVAGTDYDPMTIGTSMQAFKDSLSRASAYVLALYNLKGQRVNIPWEPLFNSLDYAIKTLSASATLTQRDTVRAALAMSREQIGQVMSYFMTLKESLK